MAEQRVAVRTQKTAVVAFRIKSRWVGPPVRPKHRLRMVVQFDDSHPRTFFPLQLQHEAAMVAEVGFQSATWNSQISGHTLRLLGADETRPRDIGKIV